MRTSASFALFILGLAVAQAIPASRIEQKSVSDEVTLDKKNINVEDAGSDKDRSKKSTTTFCVEVRPGSPPSQTPCNCKEHASSSASSSAQSEQLNVQPAPVQPAPQPAPVQTVYLPAPQPAIQPVQYIMPQPAQQYIQPSVNYVQPAISYVQPAHPAPEPVLVPQLTPPSAPQPSPTTPAPKQPTTAAPKPIPVVEILKPEEPRPISVVVPRPERIQVVVPQPEPVEMKVLPVAPICKDQMVVVQSNPMVMVPQPERPFAVLQMPHHHHQCHHHSQHALVTNCDCQPQKIALLRSSSRNMEPMHLVNMKERSSDAIYRNKMPIMTSPFRPTHEIKEITGFKDSM